MDPDFKSFFTKRTDATPLGWQEQLGNTPECSNRLIHIPTGYGKTLGVLTAWLFHRVECADAQWPRRLAWCLPMRTLVEQTREVAEALARPFGVPVHVLMGGEDATDWHLYPEGNAVLIGTQDMLLSRALNRGYAAPRARWPMEFGLLNSDCLWVMDEVQLMDVGLATSAQLQQFREDDRPKTFRPSFTWWMSATLQPEWLKSVDTRTLVETLEGDELHLAERDRQDVLWTEVSKPMRLETAMDDKPLAEFIAQAHQANSITLVIVNTVKRAGAVFDALKKDKSVVADVRLVHSRFRPHERKPWREDFLNREACINADRIVVATQVVEAGVDISADCLITDLAPWASLVQRFGRAARYGGTARVHVVDIADDKKALPYDSAELVAAREALQALPRGNPGGDALPTSGVGERSESDPPTADVAPRNLDAFEREPANAALVARLYPYAPAFLLLRKDIDELFDTTPDLTGADLDISRFIRSGVERDCQVFWQTWEGATPPSDLRPCRDELCAVPVGDLRAFADKALKGQPMWRWDYLDDAWVRTASRDIYPGQTYLLGAHTGGYSVEKGFDPSSKKMVRPIEDSLRPLPADSRADGGQDNESLSVTEAWQTIAEHGKAVADRLATIVAAVGPVPEPVLRVLDSAARWHDIGKAHPAFVSIITPDGAHPAGDIAKAPRSAWPGGRPAYAMPSEAGGDKRPGFRHELASALALLDLLRQTHPMHEALLGPWGAYLPETLSSAATEPIASPVQRFLNTLDANALNLLLYLVAAHHGKVRTGFQAAPADQEHRVAREGDSMPVRGIMEGDGIPAISVADADGSVSRIPPTVMSLEPAAIGLSPRTGSSWMERCHALQRQYGPFVLAWMEALLRAADIRVSKEIN